MEMSKEEKAGSDSYTIIESSKKEIAGSDSYTFMETSKKEIAGSDSYTIMETSKKQKTSPVNDAPPTTMTFINSNFYI